ncbi:hypothetical protein PFUGPA_05797 [Plasmodium falciparum Palo Alto/Uganda]|uniref:Uncharacterized protein n=13 Tax=Plasmodium falciparum TaxID=5833 RepID=O97261_PLAF7|nr:conserved Plasmodium protein, unknown function [Plasmodium falciparum 3D7]ETW45692.1 hypothetical protein PFMALIP_06229 [Plasmodium falciparum MaliPS096_E11]ETW52182.1 hypothetical protein PFUGPA_05797 [Plasmodium falciparum Palo Alto/Uganda]KAF4328750.1 hypothetical protein CYL21_2950 [Plasmodium falciparum NF54]PKC45478.1 hypothetical protein CK202_3839 [Plasmodium falciparum NF54]CAB38972.3 conserved Plasmodium protein, unknown function [Plasmodium falciparum 3D7]|eukprot:XP_001351214.1 conserved Plasmodium protein, unknown function [Plasmodium falciparum 3D7]
MSSNLSNENENNNIKNKLEEKYKNFLKLKNMNSHMGASQNMNVNNNYTMNELEEFEKINNNYNNNNNNINNNINNYYDYMNIKVSQSVQHNKRLQDFYNNKNSFQHYIKKLKTCRFDADDIRNLLEKRLAYERDNTLIKNIQEEENKKGIGINGNFGSESNSSSSNYDNNYLLYRKINRLNKTNTNKSKNRSRKRKRINSKIDKKYIIKCRACKFINPNGFKIEDYYTCQNCGYNDFSVIRSTSPNNAD